MKDFGAAMHEALLASNQAEIEQARALAQIGAKAVDKAVELARGAVDLVLANGKLQTDAIMANAEAGGMAMNKAVAAGIVGGTAVGTAGAAAIGSLHYGKRQFDLATSELLQDANDQIGRKFLPQRAAGQPCLPCLDESSGQARRLRIEKRQRLLLHGERSPDPTVRDAAQRLKSDMHAVELARL